MHTEIFMLNAFTDAALQFVAIVANYGHKWVFVKHKQRHTWELPGGRREQNESISQAAARELWEETGAKAFSLQPLFDYSVTRNGGVTTYGRVFYADIAELGQLPPSEIGQVGLHEELPQPQTYPDIQPQLFQQVQAIIAEGINLQ